MPIETVCPSCGRTLQVADEHAGKHAQCPVCQTVYVVPGIPQSPSAARTPHEMGEGQWEVKREGQVYGPVTKADLDRWVAENRVDVNSFVRELPHGDWLAAGKLYPVLLNQAHAGNPFTDLDTGFDRPLTRDPNVEPHRGGLILAVAILGWFMCPVLGVIALALGASDLSAMRSGTMDPEGKSMTQVGMVIGAANLVLCSCFSAPFLFIWMFARIAW